MFGKSKQPPAAEEDDLDITPMIDVTFLLLIFFMVTSNMQATSTLLIPSAKHGIGVPTDKSSVITIFKTDTDPEIYLTDGKQDAKSKADLAGVTAFVQENIEKGKLSVIIKADREVSSGFVEEVARAANDANIPSGGELQFFFGVMDKPR